MKPASQYPVTFPYGATTPPYSKSHPHTGEDRAAPAGTPIDVGDKILGLIGTTGQSTGNHVHVQKYKNGYLNPSGQGLGNTIAFPARVSEVGNNSEIGYFVRLVDNNGIRWSYFHMLKDSQKVKVGEIINKGGTMAADKLTKEDVIELHNAYFFGNPGPNYDWRHVGQPIAVLINDFKKDGYRKTLEAEVKNYPVLEKKVADLEKNQNAQYVKVSDLYVKK